jgi:predicted secreted protein
MTKFSYLIVRPNGVSWRAAFGTDETGGLQQELNKIGISEERALGICGEGGWELVTVLPGAGDTKTYYFKRPENE